MECQLHSFIEELKSSINEELRGHFIPICLQGNPNYFQCWLGDESKFDTIYINLFEEHLADTFDENDAIFISKGGKNLENVIQKWYIANPGISIDNLINKVDEYIDKQLKNDKFRPLIEQLECLCH